MKPYEEVVKLCNAAGIKYHVDAPAVWVWLKEPPGYFRRHWVKSVEELCELLKEYKAR